MPSFGPIGRRDLIAGLLALGFSGPYAGGNHQYTRRGGVGDLRVALPHPHQNDIDRDLLASILRHAGVTRDEWEAV